ncbi:MAG TPA: twin-arginine translocation signal domain-containing protein, partial [Jatrophihabitans sp.]|nr:twin-arginine translocation signal domain-containing protein [Jatrophihabitans sp.]
MTEQSPAAAAEAVLVAQADQVRAELCAQQAAWGDKGWTRRSFLAGAGMVGVAALGSQLVTTRAAYAAPAASNGNTLICIFLRGAADGLRILVPANAELGVDYLRSVRANLVPVDAKLTALSGGWALNSALNPLMPFWTSGELAFVPAVSTSGSTRSHFQAQQ